MIKSIAPRRAGTLPWAFEFRPFRAGRLNVNTTWRCSYDHNRHLSRCEVYKNLLPYLTGEKKGDVHDSICWYNADPNDAKRRHLSAVRWKNWRLLLDQKKKQWQLFDLQNDPEEKRNLAAEQQDVVEKMRLMHEEFVASLPSIDSIPKYDGLWAKPPEGWGWVIGDGK